MSCRTLTAIFAMTTVLIAAVAIAIITAIPARSEHYSNGWSWFGSSACEECARRMAAVRRARARRAYLRRLAEEEWREKRHYKVIRERWDDDDDHRNRRRHCQKKPISVVGDQYASEQGAQAEADKAWMQTARWQWGERYMVRENAAEAVYECGRSSVGSVVGQVFYRCRLTAYPCSPPGQRAN